MSDKNSKTLYRSKITTLYNKSRYYTVPEVAILLGVGKSYIYDMIAQKRLDAIRLSERRIRVQVSDLDKFTKQEMDNSKGNNYNKMVVQPPKKGRKHNVSA